MFLNQEQPERNVNFLIYGNTGSGKTALGVSAPDPVILLSERQGFETVRDHARRLGVSMPPTFYIRNRKDLLAAVGVLQTEQTAPLVKMIETFGTGMSPDQIAAAVKSLPYVKPRTVVFDSLTDMMQLVWDGITEQSPLKPAKDGLPDTTMRHWGAMATRGRAFVRMCRDLPYHILFLALLDDREHEGERVIQPSMPMRSLPAIVGAACNAIGIARVKMERVEGQETRLVHAVQFAATDNSMTKPMRPLRDMEVANMTDWIRRLEAPEPEAPKDLDSLDSQQL